MALFSCPRCLCSALSFPKHDAEQEEKYRALVARGLPEFLSSPASWTLALAVQSVECWNYTVTCDVCGFEHRYWVEPEETDGVG